MRTTLHCTSNPSEDHSSTAAHRVAMEVRWLSESVSELSGMALRDETKPLVEADMPTLIMAYTKLGFLLSALNTKSAA